MRALLLRGRSGYDATTLFIDEAAAAFGRRGIEATVADLDDPGRLLEQLAEQTAGERFDLVYSIALFGELLDADGRGVGEIVGAPHVVQYVDYPLSHHFRLEKTPASTALLVVDPSHIEAIRSVFGADRFRHVAFSPHAAIGEPHDVEPDPDAFFAARNIPVLFPGSFYKPGEAMWAKLDRATQRVFDTAVEMALACEFMPALAAFDRALDLHGGHLAEASRTKLRVNAFAVHERVRSHRRFEMLKAAARAGLPLQVFGAGYDRDLYRFKNVTHGGERTLAEIAGLMRRSRVVLNINANFGLGSHERPLSAMAAGAAAATDRSTFYEAAFEPGELVPLRWMALGEDLTGLAALLDKPQELHAIAARGQARALAAHRWDHRIDAILAAAEAVRG
ncbi:MAG: hypothetical protein JWQ29_2488 [Phenylobacterium sp.]|nr:hypothetical protein [Phenylobacterium sp.]